MAGSQVKTPGATSKEVTTSRRNSVPAIPGAPLVDLRCGPNLDVDWPESDLDVLDPPWSYVQRIGATRASNHYACLPTPEIVQQCARMRGARVATWTTAPKQFEWWEAWPLAYSGGAVWVKSGPSDLDQESLWGDAPPPGEVMDAGHYGPGFHFAGCWEPVQVSARRPAYTDRSVPMRSVWVEAPNEHSEKPVRWMAQWIRRWVPPDGLVCDPYAGLGTVACAVVLAGEGRRYLGTELDPERHAKALENIQRMTEEGREAMRLAGQQADLFARAIRESATPFPGDR